MSNNKNMSTSVNHANNDQVECATVFIDEEKNRKERTKAKLKLALEEWIKNSTSHGLPKVLSTRRPVIKVMWLFFFILAFITCVFLIRRNVKAYLEYDVVSKIRVFSEIPSVMPSLTICNINPFLTEFSHFYIKSKLEANNLSERPDLRNRVNQSGDWLKEFSLAKYLVIQNAKSHYLSNDAKKQLGYPLEDVILNCYFNGASCDANDFTWYYDTLYGNCFTFNSGFDANGQKIPLKTANRPGQFNGLYLE
jgi:hypothetical protein